MAQRQFHQSPADFAEAVARHPRLVDRYHKIRSHVDRPPPQGGEGEWQNAWRKLHKDFPNGEPPQPVMGRPTVLCECPCGMPFDLYIGPYNLGLGMGLIFADNSCCVVACHNCRSQVQFRSTNCPGHAQWHITSHQMWQCSNCAGRQE